MDKQTDGWPTDLTADEIAAIRGILVRTHELIPTPARWTRFAHARDGRGKEISALAPNAARFCLTGAIVAAIYQLFVVGRNEGMPVVERVPALKPLTAKTLVFVGFTMALISFDLRVTRLEPTRIAFLDPEHGDEEGWVYDDYRKVPASINDWTWVKHRDVLELLDQTIDFLDVVERRMEQAKKPKPVAKRAKTTRRDASPSKTAPKRHKRASKPSNDAESTDES